MSEQIKGHLDMIERLNNRLIAAEARLSAANATIATLEAEKASREQILKDIAAELLLLHQHSMSWYIGSATTKQWQEAYAAIDVMVAERMM